MLKSLMMLKDVKVIRSKRKTISLQVTRAGKVVLRVPYDTPQSFIQKILNKKETWIKKRISAVQNQKNKVVKKEFVNGEGFLYLGQSYKLHIIDENHSNYEQSKDLYFNQAFYLKKTQKKKAKRLFIEWYKRKASEIIKKRVEKYAQINNFPIKKVKITWAKKRWGSCTAKRNLCFNWRIIMAPMKVLDYVVIHELVHLEHSNHSKKFWNKVKVIIPKYKKQQKWLKENSAELSLLEI